MYKNNKIQQSKNLNQINNERIPLQYTSYPNLQKLYNAWVQYSRPKAFISTLPQAIKTLLTVYIYMKEHTVQDLDNEYKKRIHSNNKLDILNPINIIENNLKQEKDPIQQISTSGATPGFLTPHAFTKSGKTNKPTFLTKMGYKLVNQQFIHDNFKSAQQKYEYYKKIIKKTHKFDISKYKQRLIGGLSDGTKPKQITKYPLKEILMGIKVQRQHSTDKNIQLQICLDHLQQHSNYYTELKKMQNKLKRLQNKK